MISVLANSLFLVLDGLGLCPCKLAVRVAGNEDGYWNDAILDWGTGACGWLLDRLPNDPAGQRMFERWFGKQEEA